MVESYTEKMSDEVIHLKKEDQAYVKKMVAYIGAKSYFYGSGLFWKGSTGYGGPSSFRFA